MGELINCPQLSYDQFYAIANGTRVYNYGADQCVALANQYVVGTLQLPLPTGIGSARQWWDNYEADPNLYNNYDRIYEAPNQGDILIGCGSMYPPPHGHIGVVARTWDGSSFGTMEQNTGTGAARWVWRYNRNMKDILGFLRPKASQPQSRQEDDIMYAKVAYSNGYQVLWNMATGETRHIDDPWDNTRITENMRVYSFIDEAEFRRFADKYPFVLPKTDLSGVQINIDALAQAIADKLGGGISPDVTTKQDILTAIEANYPESA